MGEAANPFSILTKSPLILRDLDVLSGAATRTEVRANLSIATLDEEVWRVSEPGTPHPRRRLEAVARLNEAGIPCGVLVAPVLPGISDRPEQLQAVVEACVEAGAVSVAPILLHLRPGVKEHFLGWLEGAYPELLASYQRLYPHGRSYLPKATQAALTRRVRQIAMRQGWRGLAEQGSRSARHAHPARHPARETQPGPGPGNAQAVESPEPAAQPTQLPLEL